MHTKHLRYFSSMRKTSNSLSNLTVKAEKHLLEWHHARPYQHPKHLGFTPLCLICSVCILLTGMLDSRNQAKQIQLQVRSPREASLVAQCTDLSHTEAGRASQGLHTRFPPAGLRPLVAVSVLWTEGRTGDDSKALEPSRWALPLDCAGKVKNHLQGHTLSTPGS